MAHNDHHKHLPLTFGAIVSFSSLDSPDSFIHVDGFVKDKVLLKSFDTADPKILYSKCLFQIYPTFINTYKKDSLKLCESDDLIKRYPQEQKRNEFINDLQDKTLTEFKFNHETFR